MGKQTECVRVSGPGCQNRRVGAVLCGVVREQLGLRSESGGVLQPVQACGFEECYGRSRPQVTAPGQLSDHKSQRVDQSWRPGGRTVLAREEAHHKALRWIVE